MGPKRPRSTVPVSFDLVEKTETYLDEKTRRRRRRSPQTKNERVRQMLKTCVDNRLRFGYVVAEVWYASAENMRYVKLDLEREFIFPLKTNRQVALSTEDKQNGCYVAVSKLDLEPDRPCEAHLEGVPFALRLMRQVFTNEDESQGERYLVTSDAALRGDHLRAICQRRWKVEEYHFGPQAECSAGEVAHAHRRHTDDPPVLLALGLREARTAQAYYVKEPLRAQGEALHESAPVSLRGVARTQAGRSGALTYCVTSVN